MTNYKVLEETQGNIVQYYIQHQFDGEYYRGALPYSSLKTAIEVCDLLNRGPLSTTTRVVYP